MRKTKRNKNLPRHCEVKIRSKADDFVDFTRFVADNGYYKFKRGFRAFISVAVWFLATVIGIAVFVFTDFIGVPYILNLILIFIFSYGIMKLTTAVKSKKPKISKDEAIRAIFISTFPCEGETERESFFNFGEKGFSTNAYAYKAVIYYDYNAFYRVIECKYGLIMIRGDNEIFCIPARFFDDESACFAVEKFRKYCRSEFITTGKMKINDFRLYE